MASDEWPRIDVGGSYDTSYSNVQTYKLCVKVTATREKRK